MNQNKYKVGDTVTCNGYEGTVMEEHTGILSGMFRVRVPGGDVCVDGSNLK